MSLTNLANSKLPSRLRFETLKSTGLLSIVESRSTAQDSQGFMWFSGSSGLTRYDGYTTKTYRNTPKDPQSLSSNFVSDILIDNKDRLWVATANGGLNLYNTSSDGFTHYKHNPNDPHSLSNGVITSLFVNSTGQLYLATTGGGLNLFDPKTEKFTHYLHNPNDYQSIMSNRLSEVYVDHEGMVWIGSRDSGLDRLDPNTGEFRHFSHDPSDKTSLSHNGIFTIYEDKKNRLWVGTQAGGLNLLNRDSGHFIHYRHDSQNIHSIGSDKITAIAEGEDDTLWVGTDGGGLNILTPSSGLFIRYQHRLGDITSLPSNKIISTYRDKDGDWWFGYFPSGITRSAPYASSFTNYKRDIKNESGLSHNGILAFEEDKHGNLWVGSEDGLNYLNRATGEITQYTKGPYHKVIEPPLALHIDHQGELWIGTWSGGLSRLNMATSKFTNYQPDNNNLKSINDDKIWAVYEDADNEVWVGTAYGGLNHYDRNTGRFTTYQSNIKDTTSITPGYVQALHEDQQGRFWVGTRGGLNQMDRATGLFTRYLHINSDPTSISANSIWCITEDKSGNLWIGTSGGGLNKFDPNTGHFTAYRVIDGLPSDTVLGILEDNQGYLWLSTSNGLSKFNPITERFRHYTSQHGLPGNVFNRPAYLKTRKGELVFGSTEGFTIFDPANIFENKSAPPVVITKFELFNKQVEIGTENSPLQQSIHSTSNLTLKYNQSVFSLTFAALNYRIPAMNQYAYLLEGFESNWNYVGHKRTATYTNLDPGKYVFRVKAANSDGVWNEKGASLTITVLPPWWKTGWAYTLYGLFLLSIVIAFVRSQRKKVIFEKKVNAQLEHKVAERTAELEDKNRKIEVQKVEVEEKNKEILATQKQLIQSSKMASIGTMTAGVAHEINNPTNFAHAAAYMMHDEIIKIKAFLKQLAGGDKAAPEVLQSFDEQFTKLVELTKTTIEGTTRIKAIVEDLRTFSRIDDAKQAQVNITDLINSTVHLVQTQYDAVVIETQFDYEALFLCFPSKLNQVFMNIILNACQAIESKSFSESKLEGKLKGKVMIKTRSKDNRLIITFEDNGCGMSEQIINRIFEPFFTTKDVGSGTGLGMAISFGIIEEHGGSIDFESVVDKGTKVTIEFDVLSL